MSFNKIILVGNCTKDGEIRYSSSGMGIYNNSLAVSRKFTSNGEKKEEVCFVDFTAFARSSEICNQYLRKGSKILIEGHLDFSQWVDQNNQKRSKHSVIVETMQMLDGKSDNQDGGNYDSAPQSQPHQQQQQSQSYQAPSQQQSQQSYQQPARQMPSSNEVPIIDIDIDEDEIPF